MNRLEIVQTGGYPLNAERIKEIETAYTVFNSLGTLAGNLTIVSGCETLGSTVADGYVHINGEILEFRSAPVTGGSTVIIIEEQTNREFKIGTVKNVYTIRYATFGTSATSWPWADFKRVDSIITLMTRILTLETKLDTVAEGADKTILYKGSKSINETGGGTSGGSFFINFPDIGTSDYMVFGTINYVSGIDTDPQVTWATKNPTNTGFLFTRHYGTTNAKQFTFDFIIVAK